MSREGENDKNGTGTNITLDTLAYLVDVGGKPVPYIFAGLVGGWLATSEDLIKNRSEIAAVAMAALLAIAISLMFSPLFLWVGRWAKKYRSEHVDSNPRNTHGGIKRLISYFSIKWVISLYVGMALLILWAVLLGQLT